MTRGSGRACRTDANQVAVVEALHAAGAMVQSLAGVGAGCPDLLVLYQGIIALLEVKDGSLPPSQRELTDAELRWYRRATEHGVKVYIVYSPEQAVQEIVGTR